MRYGPAMKLTRQTLSIVYGLIALFALFGTWVNNWYYVERPSLGPVEGFVQFGLDTLANPASRSITVDLFFLSLAVILWMVLEARRLNMRGVWAYVLFGLLIAISVTVPLFLLHRERVLARLEGPREAGELTGADVLKLGLLAAGVLVYTGVTFLRMEP